MEKQNKKKPKKFVWDIKDIIIKDAKGNVLKPYKKVKINRKKN